MDNAELEEWIIGALRDIEAKAATQKLKRQNPWVYDLILVLLPYPNGLSRNTIIDWIERKRKAKGLPMPAKFEETVQAAYNAHSEASSVFKGQPGEALFYPVGGKGSGKWALHRDVAIAWLRQRGLPL